MRVAFLHPDLGIGGAERLVVDAALGLQNLGHTVDIYTSYHDQEHCFEETRDGTLNVRYIKPPFPRSLFGKFHILFAHARQLHLTQYLTRLTSDAPSYDVFFVDQLSSCVPFLRLFANKRVVFYCHFPDKLLANGAFVEGQSPRENMGFMKKLYRMPMDWWEEFSTGYSDILISNSNFSARVFRAYFPTIKKDIRTVYPGINITAYTAPVDLDDDTLTSTRPSFVSLNRFEKKKNVALAVNAYAALSSQKLYRLVLAGGYDPRLEDNMLTLYSLIDLVKSHSLTYNVISTSVNIPPLNKTTIDPDVLFILNFTTTQRSLLLQSPSTKALLYTPTNEHFGIGPVEGMICGVPVLACNSGGPVESLKDGEERTGWLRDPEPALWTQVLEEIVQMSDEERNALANRAKERAGRLFGMEAMSESIEAALKEAIEMGPPRPDWWTVLFIMVFGFSISYFLTPFLIHTISHG